MIRRLSLLLVVVLAVTAITPASAFATDRRRRRCPAETAPPAQTPSAEPQPTDEPAPTPTPTSSAPDRFQHPRFSRPSPCPRPRPRRRMAKVTASPLPGVVGTLDVATADPSLPAPPIPLEFAVATRHSLRTVGVVERPYYSEFTVPLTDTGVHDELGVRMVSIRGVLVDHPVAQAQYAILLRTPDRIMRDRPVSRPRDRQRRTTDRACGRVAQRLVTFHMGSTSITTGDSIPRRGIPVWPRARRLPCSSGCSR